MPTALEILLAQTDAAEREHFWFRGFRRFTDPLLERAAAGRTDLTLLDCGCGTGQNMVRYARYGRVFGFDLTRLGLELAARQKHQAVVQADTRHVPFASDRFDIVTSYDVLQCLDDVEVAAAYAEFHRVLRPGGWVLVNVAALELLRGAHSAVAVEVKRRTARELGSGLVRAGFRIERLTYTNAMLLPFVLPVRLAERLAGLRPAEDAGNSLIVPAKPVNALFSGLLALESRLLTVVDMPFGSSALCLAQKP